MADLKELADIDLDRDRWLIGTGWYHPQWEDPRLPTKKSLDAALFGKTFENERKVYGPGFKMYRSQTVSGRGLILSHGISERRLRKHLLTHMVQPALFPWNMIQEHFPLES